ncbi:MAG: DnaD domain protein [Anaerolineae bacterium]|nr:DnaD domain protein [Anaerolineae bacterium]
MRIFSGFPTGRVRHVSLPEPVFTELIPIIDDLAELKVTLHVFWRLERHPGKVRCVRRSELMADTVLLTSLSGIGPSPLETLAQALERAVARGTLLRIETPEELYFANTPKGRAAAEMIARGEWPTDLERTERPNIFTLYEQNIGLLTPLITEELRQAEQEYPSEWIEEAFQQAIAQNVRKWSYIRAILERWRAEGRGDETARRTREEDRRRYIEGKYGEYIEH